MNCRFKNRNRGVSLIELMIVLAIIGILAGLAGPQYRDYMKRQSLLSESRRITSLLKLARNEARSRGTFVSVAGSGSDWSGDISITEPRETIRTATSSGRILVATGSISDMLFTFNPRGWPQNQFTIAICSSLTDSTDGRLINVNRAGNITEGPIGNAACQ